MFRGKESSNRIELSRLVQELLNFGVLGSLWLWAGSRWVGGASGGMGGVSTHMHAHARTCTHAFACVHACVCLHVHVHACVHGTPPHTHTHPHPHPPIHHPPRGVDPRNHLKFDNTSTYQDISIMFEVLKFVKKSPPMAGCVVWWLDGLMGGVRSNH